MDANQLLSTLQENPRNPRTITPDDFEKLKFKIRNFPQMLEKRPIAYDSSDNYFVLGGNRRLNALQDLAKEGFAIKPEYFTDCAGWTPDQKRTFVILDNVSDGDWNYELLANEWTDLPLEEWGLNPAEWEEKQKQTNKELDPKEIGKDLNKVCPKCGFNFKGEEGIEDASIPVQVENQ